MRVIPAERGVLAATALLCASFAPPDMSCRVLAIDGPGGAGKSTLAARVADSLGGVSVVHTDNFASWENQFDWYQRLLDQVLLPLADGRPVRYQRFDWDLQRLAEWHELPPGPYLVLEGVSASREVFRPYVAATVWVQTDRAERLRRGLERDGSDALPLWEKWMAGEDDYITRERPHQRADLVVSGEGGLP